jgi:hypothetical protein
LVVSSDADGIRPTVPFRQVATTLTQEVPMYVVAQHRIKNPQTAFSRGEKLMKNEGAPPGVRNLQFYPSKDQSMVTCLWEAGSVETVQRHVDTTLGDSSENTCYEVDSEQAFARQPLGLRESAAVSR